MRSIRGKKALITGAASGIGRAVALALAREGADLHLIDIDEIGLRATTAEAEAAGVTVGMHVCDVAAPDQVSAAVAVVLSRWGAINILVNNAGIAYYGPTDQMSAAQWERILAVNLLAPIRFIHALLPVLTKQDEAHIVNVCSIFGLTSMRKGVAYQTSKFGLVGFTMGLRVEFCRPNFGVTALCPGFVQTGMLDQFISGGVRRSVPSWICTTPEKVAAQTVLSIRDNRGLVVMPALARLLWWFARLSPRLLDWLLREGWRRKPNLSAR
jgi:NAD(P)-dependent dehydrogenase (short-subunit alcohol dehydrogenase family)